HPVADLRVVGGEVGYRDVAAGGEAVGYLADQAAGVAGIGNAVQEADVKDGDGLVEVDQAPGVGVAEDAPGVTGVRLDEGRALVFGQQGLDAAVREHYRVDVDVDDPGAGRGLLGDLVHVVLGGQPAAVVDELPNAAFGSQVVHDPFQVAAVVAGHR